MKNYDKILLVSNKDSISKWPASSSISDRIRVFTDSANKSVRVCLLKNTVVLTTTIGLCHRVCSIHIWSASRDVHTIELHSISNNVSNKLFCISHLILNTVVYIEVFLLSHLIVCKYYITINASEALSKMCIDLLVIENARTQLNSKNNVFRLSFLMDSTLQYFPHIMILER